MEQYGCGHAKSIGDIYARSCAPIHYAMRCGRVDIAEVLTQQLLVRLGFDQRSEAPALQRAFTTLYTYHHRPTAEAFFARAQKEHEANERQQRLADLLDAKESGEEIKEEAKQNSADKERAGMQPIELLSDEELDKRFQQHQHRPPTPRFSRADVNVDQEENDGSGAPTALHKTKKQVRFSDNIHIILPIILPRSRFSQQDDNLRHSLSTPL